MTYVKNADRLANLLADHFNEQDAKEHGYKYKSAKEYRNILLSERWRSGKKRRAYEILPRTITIVSLVFLCRWIGIIVPGSMALSKRWLLSVGDVLISSPCRKRGLALA
jgi:hypothetical protein